MVITIKDVASAAGVSVATVSLVLNGNASKLRISDTTRVRVKQAAERLGYRPNSYAKALRTSQSATIGILAFDIVDPYCAHVMRGAESVILENQHYAVFSDLENDQTKLAGYIEFFKAKRIEGLLILASSLLVDNATITKVADAGIPLVVIGREVEDPRVPTVVTDSAGGASKVVRHLVDLGHRDICFVLGPPAYTDSQLRWIGGKRVLENAGIEIRQELVVSESAGGWGPKAAYDATERLLKRGCSFTAVVAFDDISAFGVIRALSDAGLTVPDDVSVVGFDDLSASAYYNPPLTTVHYSMVDMGRDGAKLLFEHIRGEPVPAEQRHLIADCDLVIRRSTAQPRRTGV